MISNCLKYISTINYLDFPFQKNLKVPNAKGVIRSRKSKDRQYNGQIEKRHKNKQ